eukprot:CAMPEP_0172852006 /NCGR_PEP_ID=MMETSP1075-20121228/51978_1 /TAXON_ID=2916 /ORGANISM="Ceratium fusus, Strain PA161109" /LENGTH=63 /DNA_ID=CAMNT_0013698113 /DNA_START=751 /DNA_END=938 /DNA_ORIENTATION=+
MKIIGGKQIADGHVVAQTTRPSKVSASTAMKSQTTTCAGALGAAKVPAYLSPQTSHRLDAATR